jgi:hypothetical protein
LSLVCVPTTYSGSEMTPIWGLTENGDKRTGRDLSVLPRTVLYDPDLTVGLPAGRSTRSGPSRTPGMGVAILDAALRVLADQGLESFTVAKVAAEAGTTKATVYSRYSTRMELIGAALAHLRVDDAEAPSAVPSPNWPVCSTTWSSSTAGSVGSASWVHVWWPNRAHRSCSKRSERPRSPLVAR